MAVLNQEIISAKAMETAQTTQYTSDGGVTAIDKLTVTNTGAAVCSFSANLVASGGVAGPTNLVIDDRAVAPGETYTCPEVVGHVLDDGSFIATIASPGATLVVRASGRVITA